MATTQDGHLRPRGSSKLGSFDIEIYNGASWMTLNDHLNYYVGAESLGSTQQGRKRFTVQSSMYDGDWEVHSTASSVTEQVTVVVLGVDQIQVADNLMALQDAVTQSIYNIRVTRDDLRETWLCYPAEWTIDRGQIQSHNSRAQMVLSIPRFPKLTYEVVT